MDKGAVLPYYRPRELLYDCLYLRHLRPVYLPEEFLSQNLTNKGICSTPSFVRIPLYGNLQRIQDQIVRLSKRVVGSYDYST
jgi:hypothetical protein